VYLAKNKNRRKTKTGEKQKQAKNKNRRKTKTGQKKNWQKEEDSLGKF
jgi:hypothetical protein